MNQPATESTWYVHVLSNFDLANEILVKEIIGAEYAEEANRVIECADGKKRALYRMPKGIEQVQQVTSAAAKYGFKFERYRATGKDLPMRFVLNEPEVRRKKKTRNSWRHVHFAS